jgi:hypothetical protein
VRKNRAASSPAPASSALLLSLCVASYYANDPATVPERPDPNLNLTNIAPDPQHWALKIVPFECRQIMCDYMIF